MDNLSSGIDLLIDRLNYVSDLGSGLGEELGSAPGEDGAYLKNAIEAVQWIAQRLSEDVSVVRRGLDVTHSEAAEASR
jgi:hypothetical protein